MEAVLQEDVEGTRRGDPYVFAELTLCDQLKSTRHTCKVLPISGVLFGAGDAPLATNPPGETGPFAGREYLPVYLLCQVRLTLKREQSAGFL